MNVQVFGIKNDADTRKALRFFKERRFENFSVYVDFEGDGRVATVDHQTQPWSSYVSDGEK